MIGPIDLGATDALRDLAARTIELAALHEEAITRAEIHFTDAPALGVCGSDAGGGSHAHPDNRSEV